MSLKLTSGYREFKDVNQLINEIRLALPTIVKNATQTAVSREMPSVAKKTGRMRDTIDTYLNNQITKQAGQSQINLKLSKHELSAITHYIEHHWGGAPKTNLPYYKDATTAGTRPIDPVAMMGTIKLRVKLEAERELKRRGLSLI